MNSNTATASDYCMICEREFPAGSLERWHGDVCDACAEGHDRELAAEEASTILEIVDPETGAAERCRFADFARDEDLESCEAARNLDVGASVLCGLYRVVRVS